MSDDADTPQNGGYTTRGKWDSLLALIGGGGGVGGVAEDKVSQKRSVVAARAQLAVGVVAVPLPCHSLSPARLCS